MNIYLMRSFFLPVLLFFSTQLLAQQVGEYVSVSGQIDDDLYLAGGQVDLYATVDGDVVVAGGQVNLEGDVRADVIAAGGEIVLRGKILDDARIAGGNLRVLANIGDDLVAAGGLLQLGATSEIGGSAWLSAGDVIVDGKISQALRANAGRIILNGTVGGDAEINAEYIEISSTAVIIGNLNYSSPHPATIAKGARIDGEVSYTPVDVPVASIIAGIIFAGILILLSLVITGVVLYLVFPDVAERCSSTIRDEPWSSLGYGLAVFAGGPVVIILLLSTGVGVLLALLLLAAYLVILLSGYLAGAFFVADTGLRKLNKSEAGKKTRAIALALSIVVLSIVNIIPLLGNLINWLVLLAGIGALKRQMMAAYLAK
jgi:cytoskeletal protein CcmA (bactofilin family)